MIDLQGIFAGMKGMVIDLLIRAVGITALFFGLKKSVQQGERLKQSEKKNEALENEAQSWADRPRTDDDFNDRLLRAADERDRRDRS